MARANSIWDVPLHLSNFNVTLALLGGFVSLFGLVSFLLKEHFYLSEALISLLVGVAFGPRGANFIRPRDYGECRHEAVSDAACRASLDTVTLDFSRLILGVQLVLAGVQLPSRYLWTEARPLLLLVGPAMTCMWLATSLLVWALAATPSFLHALAVGACVTPTDPVLSAVIVKGKFADQNIPKDLQDLIVAESGTNDGLGYPFLFALFLVKYIGAGANPTSPNASSSDAGGARNAIGLWFALTWAYTIILSVVYGAVVGLLGKSLLRWAKRRNYVDRESFLVFSIALALFLVGTCGLIGTDDVLACFIADNTFTWDDWFRLQTKDDSLQPTIDMLLNVTIFLWYGAVAPWSDFARNPVPSLSIWRLVLLALLVLLFRRLPWVFAMHKCIHQIREVRQAIFVGFFGPIGVSAVFYLFVSLEFIKQHLSNADGVSRDDVVHLGDTIRVVVWFLVVCSVVVHGLSIPMGKIGYLVPRTLTRVWSQGPSQDPLSGHGRSTVSRLGRWMGRRRKNALDATIAAHARRPSAPSHAWPPEALSSSPSPEPVVGRADDQAAAGPRLWPPGQCGLARTNGVDE